MKSCKILYYITLYETKPHLVLSCCCRKFNNATHQKTACCPGPQLKQCNTVHMETQDFAGEMTQCTVKLNTIQFEVTQCNATKCNTYIMRHNLTQCYCCSAVHHFVLNHNRKQCIITEAMHRTTMHPIVRHCTTPQSTATHYDTSYWTSVHRHIKPKLIVLTHSTATHHATTYLIGHIIFNAWYLMHRINASYLTHHI